MTFSYTLVALFLLEGVIGKAVVPGFRLSPSMHLGVSALMILLLVLIYFATQASGRESRFLNPDFVPVRSALAFLIVFSLISSLIRVNMLPNLLFWVVWAANIFTFFWIIPRLLRNYSVPRLINIATAVLTFSVLAGIIFSSQRLGRYGGMYGNPTTQARMLVLAYLLMFATFLSHKKMSPVTLFSGILAIPLLFLTATRASIVAALFASFSTLGVILFLKNSWRFKGNAIKFLLLLCIVLGFAANYLVTNHMVDFAINKMRVDKSVSYMYKSARAMNWESSLHDFPEYGFFGWGFLSKFGITDKVVMRGYKLPSYDWVKSHDPLNMVLSTAKQQGWLAMLAFIFFIAALWFAALRCKDQYSMSIALSVLFTGMIWGLADGNWLTTFGDPVDRLSLFILAVVLYRRPVPVRIIR